MGSLYDEDILLWSEQQTELLRRLARGERVNDAVDWENVIEELGDVGRSELNSVASLLRVGLAHLILAHAAPRRDAVGHWSAEAATALTDAAGRYAPSMGQRLDLGRLWREARAIADRKLASDGGFAAPVSEACPFAIAELVAPEPDLDALLARLAAAA
jgi:hypothetical protein